MSSRSRELRQDMLSQGPTLAQTKTVSARVCTAFLLQYGHLKNADKLSLAANSQIFKKPFLKELFLNHTRILVVT